MEIPYPADDDLNANCTINVENLIDIPIASEEVAGIIKVGEGLYMTDESLNAGTYTLPTASTDIKGGVKIGNGLAMDGDTLNVTLSGAEILSIGGGGGDTVYNDNRIVYVNEEGDVSALELGDNIFIENNTLIVNPFSKFGGNSLVYVNEQNNPIEIKLGDEFYINEDYQIHVTQPTPGKGLSLTPDGVLNVTLAGAEVEEYTLPSATYTELGGVIVGDGLAITPDGVLSCNIQHIIEVNKEQSSSGMIGTSIDWGGENYRRVGGKMVRDGNVIPPNSPETIPEHDAPYCVAYAANTWAGGGVLILPESYFYRDFKLYGDDEEEIFSTNETTYVTGEFKTDWGRTVYYINGETNSADYVTEDSVLWTNTNLAETKQLINGQTIIRVTHYIFDHRLQQNKIMAKYHSEETLSIASFIGNFNYIPETGIRGNIAYYIPDNKCYIYDGEQWLPM